jgi:predicted dehydrogenase
MKTSQRKLRWGVLGCARIARKSVIPAIVRASNASFHAIASRDQAKLGECRNEFGDVRCHESYQALLDDPEVEAVYIPLPNSLHCEWTLKAAEKGKHVLCEKPIALNAAECRKMIDACAANGVKLMEAFMYRYTASTQKVLEILRQGTLGDVKFISSTFRFPLSDAQSIKYQPGLGGGSLYDVGCYPLNFTGMVVDELARIQGSNTDGNARSLGSSPMSVSAECTKSGGVDVIFSALLKYPSGLIAAIHSGFNAQPQIEAEIVGTKAVLRIPNTFLGDARKLSLLVDGEVAETIEVPASDRYLLEVEDFSNAVLKDREPFFSLAETERNMVLLDRLYACCH